MQNYTNYHIVIIDDASNDGTGQFIMDYMTSQTKIPINRFNVIRNA